MEQSNEGFNQNGVCGKAYEAAGLQDGQYLFYPVIPFLVEASLHPWLPQQGETKGSLRPNIGGFDTLLEMKDPKMGHVAVAMLGVPAHIQTNRADFCRPAVSVSNHER